MYFGAGVLLSAMAFGTTYLGQYAYAMRWRKTGHVFQTCNILLVSLSYVVFLLGLIRAREFFLNYSILTSLT